MRFRRRRAWLGIVGVGAVSLVLSTTTSGVAPSWPQFRFDSAHSGASPSENTITTANVANLAQAWAAETGEQVRSSPAVAGGVVYVGSNDDKLYAFDAATGARLWTATTGGDVQSSPAGAGGVVYVGSFDNKLLAFDAAGTTGCSGTPKTCTPLWSGSTGDHIFSSPAVAGGVVYVGSFDRKLYAFDAAGTTGCSGTPKTCAPLW